MLTRWLYFRAFGLTATVATLAYWVQLPGLALARGIAPIAEVMEVVRARLGFFDCPSLLWLSASDAALQAVCALCVTCSLLVLLDVAVPFALFGLFVGWASLVNVGQPFLSFQWDIMLCEAALLSIPYALRPRSEPEQWQRLLVGLLAAKVTLESGIVKLSAHDPSWWPDLTALTYHYWTQPLPAWTSVFVDRLPLSAQKISCAVMFVLELGFPLLAFGPRRARAVAAFGIIALQVGLALVGNYAYFNLLTAVLCLPLLDDRFFRGAWKQRLPASPREAPKHFAPFGWAALVVYVLGSALIFGQQFRPEYPAEVQLAIDRLEAIKAVSAYGVFRVMTKTRPEIVFEGSDDGVHWVPYELPWKPGALGRRPRFVAPWQPRLDWQLWFAAMGHCDRWVVQLLKHLLEGTPEVLALFEDNPFAAAPPRFVRSTLWQYRFAPAGSPDWWQRSEDGPYCPTVLLDEQGRLLRAP
ncbi:MAG: lipase maturation factor family protein [Archangiaceae bacterium]|nr:lipase maturation factor family protein [Archangiaceae bacterium]